MGLAYGLLKGVTVTQIGGRYQRWNNVRVVMKQTVFKTVTRVKKATSEIERRQEIWCLSR